MEVKEYIQRIVKLTEEKAEVQADIKQLYTQAKGEGHSIQAIKRVIKLLKMSKADRDELQFLIDTYLTQAQN